MAKIKLFFYIRTQNWSFFRFSYKFCYIYEREKSANVIFCYRHSPAPTQKDAEKGKHNGTKKNKVACPKKQPACCSCYPAPFSHYIHSPVPRSARPAERAGKKIPPYLFCCMAGLNLLSMNADRRWVRGDAFSPSPETDGISGAAGAHYKWRPTTFWVCWPWTTCFAAASARLLPAVRMCLTAGRSVPYDVRSACCSFP